MKAFAHVRPVLFVLIAISSSLVALIAEMIWHGTEVNVLLATAPQKVSLHLPELTAPELNIDLASIQEHALFHATRHYYTAPPPSTTPITPPTPDYRLVGTLVVPQKPTVALLVSNSTGASRKIRSGDELDGWFVQSVENRRVVLQFEQQSAEILTSARNPAKGLTSVPLARSASTQAAHTRVLGYLNAPREIAASSTPVHGESRLYRPPLQ